MAQIALVTGANRGIGFEIARQLSKLGFHIIVTSRDKNKGAEAAEKLFDQGGHVSFCELDVTEQGSVDALAEFVQKKHGRLDVLVNNAGVFLERTMHPQSAEYVPIDVVKETMDTNFYGPYMLCQAFIPMMKRQQSGRIINISSSLGSLNNMKGGYPGYRVSKTAVNALTKMLADELSQHRILVNSMCPGWVRTEMGGEGAQRNVDKGAETAVWLATAPSIPSGKFFLDKREIPW